MANLLYNCYPVERLGIGSTRKFENGFSVSVRKIECPRQIPGSVAKHEAAHVIASRKIISATIIPSGNALGTTVPEKMTPAAAAAADALGYDGTGWDMHLCEHYLRVSPGIARAAAKKELSGQEEEMFEVASILEERKTIGQKEVEEARENVRRKRRGIHVVEVQIFSPQGNVRSFNAESFKGEVSIIDLIETLPKAA
jgi:hypothetical protein